jgi:murein L,D-transpeptidase YcbB/YkuD
MKLGDVGNDVHEWRIFLEGEENAALPGDPRVFTPAVHNATVAYQKSRGLVPDGKVGPAVRAALGKPKRELLAAVRFDERAIRYVEAVS